MTSSNSPLSPGNTEEMRVAFMNVPREYVCDFTIILWHSTGRVGLGRPAQQVLGFASPLCASRDTAAPVIDAAVLKGG